MSQEVFKLILSAIGLILTGLAGWVTTMLTSWLNTKIKDKKMAQHATAITTIVMSSVQIVFQTFVDSLKKSGEFDMVAAKEAKDRCIKIIKTQLTPELMDYIQANFGEIEEYISNQVEAMIYQLKK